MPPYRALSEDIILDLEDNEFEPTEEMIEDTTSVSFKARIPRGGKQAAMAFGTSDLREEDAF